MISRGLSILACLLCVPAALSAQEPGKLDPEAATPYAWQILLHTKPHPQLGPAFRADVRRELLAALQPPLGTLGTVEVIDLASLPRDRWPALAKEYDARGWTALDASAFRELTGTKTQILHLEVRGGEYHIETRQVDGVTGLPLPVSRRHTPSAELVGRLAGLMLDRDFGVNGTIEFPAKSNDEVLVRLQGGGLGSLDRYVKVGDVFAVVGVRKSARPAPPLERTATGKLKETPKELPPVFTAATREFTVLKAMEAPKDGVVRCSVFTGYGVGQALPLTSGILGYRCLKLPTITAPLALKLVGRGGLAQKSTAATVRANDIGWRVPPGKDELELRDGVFRSSRPLTGLAFVTLAAGPTRTASVPIPVLGTDPVPIPFILDPLEERRVAFERDCSDLTRRVAEARITQNGYFDSIGKLITAQRNREALARAMACVALTDADDKELEAALARLRTQLTSSPAMGRELEACERQLADLRKNHDSLVATASDLDRMVARENDPTRAAQEIQAEAINTRIKLLLERGEVDEALTMYEQLLTILPGDAQITARRDKLREEWRTKSDEHAKAREYITRAWPALATVADLKEGVKPLDAAIAECIRQQDRYTLRRFLAAKAVLPVKVTDLTQTLDAANEADRVTIGDASTMLEAVNAIEAKVREFLKG